MIDYEFDDDETSLDDDAEQATESDDSSDNLLDEDSGTELSEEAGYICNSCGEEIIVPLDYSEGQRQEYVEDCPVCCNPNVIFVDFDADGQANIWSRAEQDPR